MIYIYMYINMMYISTHSWCIFQPAIFVHFQCFNVYAILKDLAIIYARQHYKIHTQHLGLPAVLRHAAWLRWEFLEPHFSLANHDT